MSKQTEISPVDGEVTDQPLYQMAEQAQGAQ